MKTFQEEYRAFLKKYPVEGDQKLVWIRFFALSGLLILRQCRPKGLQLISPSGRLKFKYF